MTGVLLFRVSANTSEGWLACFTRKDRSMTGSDERNTQNATSVGKAAFPAPSAMKSPHPNRRQRHVVLRRRNYSPHHSHPHPAVRDLNVIMVFWGMRHSHFFEQFRIRSESIEHQSGVRAATFSQDVSSYLISRTLVIERDYDVGKLLTRTGATSTGIPTTAGRFRVAATRRSKE